MRSDPLDNLSRIVGWITCHAKKSGLFPYLCNALIKCSFCSRSVKLLEKMEQYTSTSSGEQIVVQTANGQIQQQVSKRGEKSTFDLNVTIKQVEWQTCTTVTYKHKWRGCITRVSAQFSMQNQYQSSKYLRNVTDCDFVNVLYSLGCFVLSRVYAVWFQPRFGRLRQILRILNF